MYFVKLVKVYFEMMNSVIYNYSYFCNNQRTHQRKRKKKKSPGVHAQRKDSMRTQQEGGRLQAKEASGETRPADILILDFFSLRDNRFLLVKPPRLWCFAVAALAKKYTIIVQ